jgi:hypothetical protein
MIETVPYNDRLTGEYYTKQVTVSNIARPISSEEESLYINIVVPDSKPNGAENTDIYEGDAQGQWKQRLTGTESGNVPINNLNKKWLRTKSDDPDATAFVFVEVYK